MKTRAILLLMVAVAFVSFAMPCSSFACTQPPIQPSSQLLKLTTWPAYAGVGVMMNNVPNLPATTAIANWNSELFILCGPGFGYGTGFFYSVAMPFTTLPAPATCSPNSTCFTRGLTNFTNWDANGRLETATMQINNAISSTAAMTEVIAHEFGHTMGLLDCNYPACAPGSSVMESGAAIDVNGNPVTGLNSVVGQPGPTNCDFSAVIEASPDYVCPAPPPPDNPPCDLGTGTDNGRPPNDCSPIILDIDGKGFNLTSAVGGVLFDISGTGHPIQMGWTAQGANNAFLALPGPDGLVHNGKQLFGNFTPQPPSNNPNGFAALAVYDLPANGGNGDGVIDSRDAIYPYLRLWIDANHDGICQPEELHTLASLGVNSISLNYTPSRKVDKYGNVFRYRDAINPDDPDASPVDRKAYDVFFVTLSPSGSAKNSIPHRLNLTSAQKCPVTVPTGGAMLPMSGTLR